MEQTYAIELKNITKRFGKIVANDGINLKVKRGEILSLLGENGSGKTTLMNMISGIYFPDEGRILVDGKAVSIRSPKDSFDLGIGMIHQHFKLIDVMTAAENIILGLKGNAVLDMKKVHKDIQELVDRYGFGLDLIKYVFEDIIRLGCKFAILGSGEKIYEDFFSEMHYRYPDRVGLTIGFVPELSKKIYAGADMFLMPSQSEPCGLAQMIALRYGTIPIVRETGGLRDSIHDAGDKNGNGFTFKSYNAHDMLDAVVRARAYYDDKMKWGRLVNTALKQNFSWTKSAKDYIALYNDIH